MIQEWYFDLYFFLIRLCTCMISVLLHRGIRSAKLRKEIFPRWVAMALVVDILMTTKPPWVEVHKIEVTPKQLLASLLSSTSLQWPLLWWVNFMEAKRRGLSLLLGMAMLFHRSTMALVLFRSQYVSWAHAVLALLYVWCTLSLRTSAKKPAVATIV